MPGFGKLRRWIGLAGMLALVAVALSWASAPVAADAPVPQEYNPGEIFDDTYSDWGSALNVTVNQSERMEFFLDCPPVGDYDYLYVWLSAGMDLSVHLEVDPAVSSSFRGYLVSPEYFRLVVATVPPSGASDAYFNTTTRIDGPYYFVADGFASCVPNAMFYNVTWTASPTGAPNDGDNSVAAARLVANNTTVSSSVTETTDQADFLRVTITVTGGNLTLLRLASPSGGILTNGFQFEVYNSTSILTVPPTTHEGLNPNSTGMGLIQNGLQVTESSTLIIRLWSNGISGAYSFRLLVETVTPSDTNLDFASAHQLTEMAPDGGLLNYTYERTHFHKIFIGSARTVHIQAWSDTINIGLRVFNEQTGTLTHFQRGSSRHNPVSTQTPQDIEVIHHYASAFNLSGETGWYYVEVTIDDNLVPDGAYGVAFYFNDGPVAYAGIDNRTTLEDTPITGYDVSALFSDLDCWLDAADDDCSLSLRMVASSGTNLTWNFSGDPLLLVTPAGNWSGQGCADFEATDSWNESAVSSVCVTVTAVNDAPEIFFAPGVPPDSFNVSEDSSIVRLVSSWFTDIDGDALTITVTGNTNIGVLLEVISDNVQATMTPAPNWNGCEDLTYTATDPPPENLSVSHTVRVCVLPGNDAPVIRGGLPQVLINEDAVGSMDLSVVLINGTTGPAFEDIDGNLLSYIVYDEVGVDVIVTGSVLTITPGLNFVGLASFFVAAYDGITESSRAPVRVRVAAVNDNPTIDSQTPTTSPVIVLEGEAKSFTATASDIDGDSLSFTWYVDGVGQTGEEDSQFSLDVPITDELARSVVVRVEVSDGAGGTAEVSWTVTIENTNLAPRNVQITSPVSEASFSAEEEITFSSTAEDADGDELAFSWTSDRVGAAIGTEQTFSTTLPAGQHLIRLVVSDGTTTSETNITITVVALPDPEPPFLPGLEGFAVVVALALVAGAAALVGARRRR